MRHDVFISFRGDEIRKTFLSHLIHSLDRKGIRSVTSAGNYPSWNQAVRESRVAISVISKSCTSMDLWVEELDSIIACEKKTIPVFLRINPLDVLGDLNLALVGTNQALETVKNWLDDHVVSKSGFNSSDWEDDSQLVDQITCFVSDNLKQDFVSGHLFPNLNWLKSTSVRQTSLITVPTFDSARFWPGDMGTVGYDNTPSRTIGSHSMGDRKTSPGWYDNFNKVKIPFLNRRKGIKSPPLLPSSSSYKSPKSPISHHKKSYETVNELPSSSKPSETSIELPEQLTTIMNPFAEHSGCDLVGMNHHVKEVLSMLQQGDSTKEVRTIGIYGIEGVGKTTLAKYVYEEISLQFQYRFFMTNLSKQGSSLIEIFANNETLSSTTSFSEMIGRKVLLVVDSGDDIKQLKDFADQVSLFGPGSRVIVITQSRSLLSQYGVKLIYEVTCPGFDESIQIFSQFAFKQTDPASGFESLSGRAIDVASRIPLALKVLGSYLYGKREHEWESTLGKLEESDNKYIKAEVIQSIREDYFVSRLELEENEFPLYSFTF